jgi:hypothetical protein
MPNLPRQQAWEAYGKTMMSEADPQPGMRFSHFYAERGEPTADSKRMRNRIGWTIASTPQLQNNLRAVVGKELGVSAPATHSWTYLVNEMTLSDLLDLVTVTAEYLKLWHGPPRKEWIEAVDRIFREENVHYRVEPEGGVRFHIDDAFARARASAIAAMAQSRYANALAEFEKGMAALATVPPDGKGAIRGVFGAAEGLFRLITSAARLGGTELAALSPILQKQYVQQETALRASSKMLASFKDWVEAAHFYRHEEGAEEPAQPPLSVALHIVGTGISHLRWLAELDAQMQ